jgi:hypothetical protein
LKCWLGVGLAAWSIVAGGGLLAGCDTVDLGAPPADVNACRPSQAFFRDRIWPEFLDKDYSGKHCNDSSCHDTGKALTIPNPAPSTDPLNPVAPIPFPPDWAANYKSATENMQCTNVAASALLVNPAGLVTHGGGKLIDPNGPEATLLVEWVSAP